MAGVTLTFILLAALLGASSLPLPNTQVASVSTTSISPAADAASPAVDLLHARDPSPESASSAPAPSQLAVTSPIGFGDLNAPSEGASFTDFSVSPEKRDSIALVSSKHDIIKARAPNVHGKELGRKRSFQPGTESGGGGHGKGKHAFGVGLDFGDVFEAKAGKGKGAKAAKAAKAPATAPGKAASQPQAAGGAAPPANTVTPSASDQSESDEA